VTPRTSLGDIAAAAADILESFESLYSVIHWQHICIQTIYVEFEVAVQESILKEQRACSSNTHVHVTAPHASTALLQYVLEQQQ
jgi:hypothetical protein